MGKQYEIAAVDDPEDSVRGIIGQGLNKYNIAHAGEPNFQKLCFVVRGDESEIFGGVLAECYWGWLFVKLLWVHDSLRGQGFGVQLLSRVEDEARRLGVGHVYLDTFSFQAPEFYKKLGYEVFGQLDNFPGDHKRFFLKKEL